MEAGNQLLAEGGGLDDGDVVEQAEHPGADGGEGRHAEHEVDRTVVEPAHHLVLTDLVGDPTRLEPVDPDPHLDPVLALHLPRLVGQTPP